MSGDFLETSRPVLAWILRTTWEASLLALLVLMAQWLLRGRVSARWRYNLWLLVVARLVLPAVPGSRVSPFNLVRLSATETPQRFEPARPLPGDASPAEATPRRSRGPAPLVAPARRDSGNLFARQDAPLNLSPRDPAPPALPVTTRVESGRTSDAAGYFAASGPGGVISGLVEVSAAAAGPQPPARPRPTATVPVSMWTATPPAVLPSSTPRTVPSREASAAPAPAASSPAAAPWFERVNWLAVLAVAWVGGAAFVACRLAWVSLRLARVVRRLPAAEDPALVSLLRDCARRLRVTRTPRLVRASDNFGPALVGLLRPRIVLPECVAGGGTFDRNEVRLILMHELAHLKRRDVAANWLLAALGVLHWFNPVLWLAFRRMRADRELACDEMVLNANSPGAGSAYGPTLLKLLQTLSRGRRPMPGMVGVLEGFTRFTNPQSSIRRRIAMIARFDRQRATQRGSSALGVAVTVLAAGVAFTGAVRTRGASGPGGVTPAASATPAVLSATRLVSLRHMDAGCAAALATPLLREHSREGAGAAGSAAPDERTNTLVLSGAARDVESLEKIVKAIDAAPAADRSHHRVFSLSGVSARLVAELVTRVGMEASADERANILTVRAGAGAIRAVEAIVRHLESGAGDEGRADADGEADEVSGEAAATLEEAREHADAARQQMDEARAATEERRNALAEQAAEAEHAIAEARQQIEEQNAQAEEAIAAAKASMGEVRESIDQQIAQAREALEGAKQAAVAAREQARAEAGEAKDDSPAAEAEERAKEQVAAQESAVEEATSQGAEALRQAQEQIEQAVAQKQESLQEARAAVEEAVAQQRSVAQEVAAAVQEAEAARQTAEQEHATAQAGLAEAQNAFEAEAQRALSNARPPQGVPTAESPAPGEAAISVEPDAPGSAGPSAPGAGAPPAPEPPAALPPSAPSSAAPAPPARPVRALPAPTPAPVAAAADPAGPSSAAPAGGYPGGPGMPPGGVPTTAAPAAGSFGGMGANDPATTPPAAGMPGPGFGGSAGRGRGQRGGGPGAVGMGGAPGMPMYPGMGPAGGMPWMGGSGMPGMGGGGGGGGAPASSGWRVEDPSARAANAAATRSLRTPTPIDFDGVALGEALAQIADRAGVDIVIDWKALESSGIDRTTAVTLRLRKDVPAEQVLTWVLRSAGGDAAGFTINHGVVVVSTKDTLNRVLVTRAYDVRWVQGTAEELESLIRESVGSDAWQERGGPGSVRVFNQQLFVTTSEPNHRQVERLLGLMQAQGVEGPRGGAANRGQNRLQPGGIPGGLGGGEGGGGGRATPPGGFGGGAPAPDGTLQTR